MTPSGETPAGGTAYPTSVPNNGGLNAVGPKDATPLPAAEKPDGAPQQVKRYSGSERPLQRRHRILTERMASLRRIEEGRVLSSSKHKPKKGAAS